MITTAQMYGISQTKLDELCHELQVYPVPDYERFFINRFGKLYAISIDNNGSVSLQPLTPYEVEDNGYCKYSIVNSNNEIDHITNVELCALTFYGYFPAKYIYVDGKFESSASIKFKLGKIGYISEDKIMIHGILFKRIYINGNLKSHFFISKKGVVFNENRFIIIPHQFQHNMYWRHYVTVDYTQYHLATHRLVYSTWSDSWLPDTVQINHKDGFKYHNFLENLEVVSQVENIRHAKKIGLKPNPYDEDFIEELCKLIESNQYDIKEICEMLGKSDSYRQIKSLIQNIIKGRTWKDIGSKYDFSNWKNQIYNKKRTRRAERLVHAICKTYMDSNYDIKFTRNQFPDVSVSYINEICRGDKFPDIAAQYGLPLESVKRSALSKAQYREVIKMYTDGKSVSEIASHFGVNEKLIKQKIYINNYMKRKLLGKEGSTTIETVA